MPRPKIKNKKPRVNMTLNSRIVEEARAVAEREGLSLSELVETLLAAHNIAANGDRPKSITQRRAESVAQKVATR